MRFVFMAATLASERLTPEVSENNLIWSDVRYWWSVKAEFVAFGVGHDDEPVFQGRVRVDSAKPGSSEFRQSAAFGFERVHPFIAVESGRSPNVEVQAVLHRFGLRYGLEEDAGADLIWVFDRGAHVFGTEFDSEVGDESLPGSNRVFAFTESYPRRAWNDVGEYFGPESGEFSGS
jgi:hypothetical protein